MFTIPSNRGDVKNYFLSPFVKSGLITPKISTASFGKWAKKIKHFCKITFPQKIFRVFQPKDRVIRWILKNLEINVDENRKKTSTTYFLIFTQNLPFWWHHNKNVDYSTFLFFKRWCNGAGKIDRVNVISRTFLGRKAFIWGQGNRKSSLYPYLMVYLNERNKSLPFYNIRIECVI